MSAPPPSGNGLIGPLAGLDTKQTAVIGALCAIAWVFALEVVLKTLTTFPPRTLYFWSLIASCVGIIVHALGNLLKFLNVLPTSIAPTLLITFAWWPMVTGQSLVLYSRLHIVMSDSRRLRYVLYLIIFDAIVLHIPTTTVTIGSNTTQWRRFVGIFTVIEKVQISIFAAQEVFLSGIYIYHIHRLLKNARLTIYREEDIKRGLMHLFWVNVLVIGLDLGMLISEYLGQYYVEACLKPTIYAYKLRIEFAVLNRLVRMFCKRGTRGTPSPPLSDAKQKDSQTQHFSRASYWKQHFENEALAKNSTDLNQTLTSDLSLENGVGMQETKVGSKWA